MNRRIIHPRSKRIPWWRELFQRELYGPVFDAVPVTRSAAEVRFIMKGLKLRTGDSLLDICCGIGRHLIPLAKLGIRVTGVDLSSEFLKEAERKARKSKVKLSLICEDVRRIKFRSEFSGVINMWTSIGFFEKEADNFKVVKKAYAALRPGGAFLVNTINRDWVARHFERRGWWGSEGVKILEDRSFDFATGRSNSRWTFMKNGEKHELDVSLRMYCFHELREYFRRAGFEDIQGYGSVAFSPIDFDSRMLYVVGKKPG